MCEGHKTTTKAKHMGNDGNIKVKKRRRRIIQILSKQELDFGSSILQWYSVKRNGAIMHMRKTV